MPLPYAVFPVFGDEASSLPGLPIGPPILWNISKLCIYLPSPLPHARQHEPSHQYWGTWGDSPHTSGLSGLGHRASRAPVGFCQAHTALWVLAVTKGPCDLSDKGQANHRNSPCAKDLAASHWACSLKRTK